MLDLEGSLAVVQAQHASAADLAASRKAQARPLLLAAGFHASLVSQRSSATQLIAVHQDSCMPKTFAPGMAASKGESPAVEPTKRDARGYMQSVAAIMAGSWKLP